MVELEEIFDDPTNIHAPTYQDWLSNVSDRANGHAVEEVKMDAIHYMQQTVTQFREDMARITENAQWGVEGIPSMEYQQQLRDEELNGWRPEPLGYGDDPEWHAKATAHYEALEEKYRSQPLPQTVEELDFQVDYSLLDRLRNEEKSLRAEGIQADPPNARTWVYRWNMLQQRMADAKRGIKPQSQKQTTDYSHGRGTGYGY